MRPDLATLRVLPWQAATALVICDFHQHDGKKVAESPRSVLQRQLELLGQKKFLCNIASELEFFLSIRPTTTLSWRIIAISPHRAITGGLSNHAADPR